MDIRNSLIAQTYAATKPAVAADQAQAASAVAQDFWATLKAGEDTAIASMTTGADPHALVQALAQTELAVQTATAVRDRVVEAYQEILRMPV